MANIKNLERQHLEIKKLFSEINEKINSKDVAGNIDDLVKDINILAGKLNIHMSSEDKFLYPTLIESDNKELREIAKEYSSEMGDIFAKFNDYKSKFNTKNKILGDVYGFIKESKQIVGLLESRISKEDKHLYPRIAAL
ncbi:hemerythrin domain-containing protein [Clostridium cibarium]|uniref:Hemerythrin domain-containing protein n=1 Tax=Clostridium cibarium TaxID=2762247 RepID=A0ABR8PV05_9CLOT|nr:hemerythrin domain-containing protein [Clostridium cibarium]MBD7911965.1 hemerythrin domain-containing protein [Clostridium cibarium]